MNYKFLGSGGKFILKNLSFDSVIGKGYLNPALFLQLSGHVALILKEGLVYKDPEFHRTGAFLSKQGKVNFTDHFVNLSKRIKKEMKDASEFKFFLLLNREIEVQCNITAIGNTSCVADSTVFDATEKKLLATGAHNLVCVNKYEGVKRPVPNEYRKHVTGRMNSSVKSANFNQRLDFPKRRCDYNHSIKLGILNAGFLGYTPHDQYLTFCLDCLASYMSEKGLSHMPGTVWDYCVHSCQLFYLRASGPGDTLELSVWNDSDDIWRFYFKIQKEGKDVCEVALDMENN